MTITNKTKALFVVALALLAALLFLPQTGEARTLAQAQNDANYYSSIDCPHHTLGKCMHRDSWIAKGIGGGRWTATARGWECNVAEPCAFMSWTVAHWYYERDFWIENDGSRSHVSDFY